ncbi:MAG: TPM domain-containing protein [Candidatus Aureabacteria bacterium]|nr:TPM domain-containing protein [Candidatus Auribacterota bacterium]
MIISMVKIYKYVLVCFLVLFSSSIFARDAVHVPSRGQGYVNDFAGLLSHSDKLTITKFAAALEKKTTAQIAIVTIKTTKPETIQGFSVKLFDQWKIGQKGKDNGVLLLMAVDDRKAWITTGYGMEGAIPDVIANKIVRDVMIPYFKRGQYSAGVTKGAIAIVSLVAKEYDVEITGQETQIHQAVHRKKSGLQIIFTILLFVLIIGMRSGLLGYFLLGSMIGGRRRGGHWYGAGSGGSGGGFSGGFGGFGGGMTGGGGGGGGW